MSNAALLVALTPFILVVLVLVAAWAVALAAFILATRAPDDGTAALHKEYERERARHAPEKKGP